VERGPETFECAEAALQGGRRLCSCRPACRAGPGPVRRIRKRQGAEMDRKPGGHPAGPIRGTEKRHGVLWRWKLQGAQRGGAGGGVLGEGARDPRRDTGGGRTGNTKYSQPLPFIRNAPPGDEEPGPVNRSPGRRIENERQLEPLRAVESWQCCG